MTRWDFDEVDGIVIGGDYFTGQIYYDGRQQSQIFYADTEDELRNQANNIVSDLKRENCPFGLYDDSSKWELRIYK